jgi:hypothetical protein
LIENISRFKSHVKAIIDFFASSFPCKKERGHLLAFRFVVKEDHIENL